MSENPGMPYSPFLWPISKEIYTPERANLEERRPGVFIGMMALKDGSIQGIRTIPIVSWQWPNFKMICMWERAITNWEVLHCLIRKIKTREAEFLGMRELTNGCFAGNSPA